MADTWIVTYARIEEYPVPGKPLGRHVRHDSRNRAYPWRRRARFQLTSQLWPRHIGILDQGNVGSCTGEEETGALGTDPVFGALPAGHPALDQNLALKIYSAAETLDGDGPYPPNDNGSTGPSVAQVAKTMGLISGYLHCFSLADVLDALESGPVGIGSNWYDSMDSPDSSGLVSISPGAQVRGGHEYLCRGKDVTKQLVHLDNSWGTGFGVNGSFSYSYATLDRLLHEQGDGTVSLPLSFPLPPPVPVPVPPGPGPDTNPDDDALALAVRNWAQAHHAGSNARAAAAVSRWLAAKGFSQ